MEERQILKVAIVLGAILFPVILAFGVSELVGGDWVQGTVLTGCVVLGVANLVAWRVRLR